MKRVLKVIFLLAAVPCSLYSMEYSGGLTVSSDALMASFGVSPVKPVRFVLEGGPAFEREADLRVNDSCWHLGVEYTPRPEGRWDPYLSMAYEIFLVDTSYAETVAQGVLLGGGVAWHITEGHSLTLEGGWRSTKGDIHSHYDTPDFTVFYDEVWRAPTFCMELGWRIRFKR